MEEKMKSKIEKLGHFLIPCSTDEGVVNVLQRISEKVDELVEVYNSQSQPEEKPISFTDALTEMGRLDNMTTEEINKEVKDTPEEWVCPKCGFDDCYPYKNSEDFGLIYCPACSELVKLNSKKK